MKLSAWDEQVDYGKCANMKGALRRDHYKSMKIFIDCTRSTTLERVGCVVTIVDLGQSASIMPVLADCKED